MLDVIGRLVDKSLVQLDDTSDRYRLLETIRQFCLDRLRDAGEVGSTRERHAAWFAGWCVSLGQGTHDFDIGPSHPSLPDVFAALEWAYDAAPADAYRISRGLAGPHGLIGRFAEFDRQYDWLASRDGSDDPTGWASAVAGLGHLAMTFGRFDYLELAARAEPLLASDDGASWCFLRIFPATLDAVNGDDTELRQLVAVAKRVGDDHALRLLAISLAVAQGNAGKLHETDAAISLIRQVLDRRRLPFALDTALGAVGMALFMAIMRGDFDEARALAACGGQPDSTQVHITTMHIGLLGYLTGDRDLVARAASLQAALDAGLAGDGDTIPAGSLVEGGALNVHCYEALIEERYDDALALLRRCHQRMPLTAALRSFVLVPLAIRLLEVGQRDELARHVDTLATDCVRIGNPPRPVADLHYIRSLVARADGDVDEAWQHAHAALDVAQRTGLRIVAIDALHLLADLAARRGHRAMAARLLRRRGRRTCPHRLRHSSDPRC